MSEELLRELLEMVQNVSPLVWEAAAQRLTVIIVSDLIWAAILFAAGYGVYRLGRREDEYIWFLCAGILAFSGAVLVTSALMYAASFDYSVVRLILNIVD